MYTKLSYDTNIHQNVNLCHSYKEVEICAYSAFISLFSHSLLWENIIHVQLYVL